MHWKFFYSILIAGSYNQSINSDRVLCMQLLEFNLEWCKPGDIEAISTGRMQNLPFHDAVLFKMEIA